MKSAGGDHALRVLLIGILRVLSERQTKMLFIRLAGSAASVFTDFLEDREQNCRQNCTNLQWRNDYQVRPERKIATGF